MGEAPRDPDALHGPEDREHPGEPRKRGRWAPDGARVLRLRDPAGHFHLVAGFPEGEGRAVAAALRRTHGRDAQVPHGGAALRQDLPRTHVRCDPLRRRPKRLRLDEGLSRPDASRVGRRRPHHKLLRQVLRLRRYAASVGHRPLHVGRALWPRHVHGGHQGRYRHRARRQAGRPQVHSRTCARPPR